MFAPYNGLDPYYGYSGSSWCGWYPGRSAHGRVTLAETSPPQSWTEPLAVPEVAAHLKLPLSDDEIARLPLFIAAARSVAEGVYNRVLAQRQFQFVADYWNSWRVELGSPLISVDSVQYTSSDGIPTQMAKTTDYLVDLSREPGGIIPAVNSSWPAFSPWPSGAVQVLFTAGYAPDSPFWQESAHLKIGMLYLITEWFTNRLPFTFSQDELPKYGATYLLSHGARVRVK